MLIDSLFRMTSLHHTFRQTWDLPTNRLILNVSGGHNPFGNFRNSSEKRVVILVSLDSSHSLASKYININSRIPPPPIGSDNRLWKVLGKSRGKIWIIYIEPASTLANARVCVTCDRPWGLLPPSPWSGKPRILHIYTAAESEHPLWERPSPIPSHALSCREYVQDSLFSRAVLESRDC